MLLPVLYKKRKPVQLIWICVGQYFLFNTPNDLWSISISSWKIVMVLIYSLIILQTCCYCQLMCYGRHFWSCFAIIEFYLFLYCVLGVMISSCVITGARPIQFHFWSLTRPEIISKGYKHYKEYKNKIKVALIPVIVLD